MANESEAWRDLGGNVPGELPLETKRAMRAAGMGKPIWDREIEAADREVAKQQEREAERHFGAIAAEGMVMFDEQTDALNREKYIQQGMSEEEADQQVRLDRIARERNRHRKA